MNITTLGSSPSVSNVRSSSRDEPAARVRAISAPVSIEPRVALFHALALAATCMFSFGCLIGFTRYVLAEIMSLPLY